MPAFDRPEILEAELSGLVLDCAAWGTPPAELAFQDRPSAGALSAATGLLVELGALEPHTGDAAPHHHRITDRGRHMARLGAHPRLAAMLLSAATPPEAALAADLAALLEERDPLRSPEAPCDIALRLAALTSGHPDADRAALSRIRRGAEQYRRRLRVPPNLPPRGDPGRLLAAAFPDRIAQRRGEPGSFRLSGGGGAKLPRADPLANASLLAIASLEMKASARIRLAAPLDPDALPAVLEARVTEQVEGNLDPASGSVLARRRRRLGALVLSDRTERAAPADMADALARAAAGDGLRALPWGEPTRQLQARVALMRNIEPDSDWPDLSDIHLAETVSDWLAPHLTGMTKLADLQRLDLTSLLRQLMPWSQANRLDQLLPTHLTLPGGRAAVDYTQPVPLAEARAQAFYGLRETPRLAGGRVPLRLALLSPAGRPVAVTADLAGFWTGAWADVRRDMRGRYPKHRWPEDGGAPSEP